MLKRLLASVLFILSANGAQASNLSAECTVEDEAGCLVSMVLAYYANRTYGIDIGVEESSSDKRSALYLAANKLSMAMLSPETFEELEKGHGVFQSNPMQANAASKRLRALFSYEDDFGQRTTIAVNDKMTYALAYNITAAFWNNFPTIRRELVELSDDGAPFAGLNMKLHPGALRYFESNGFDVPQEFR